MKKKSSPTPSLVPPPGSTGPDFNRSAWAKFWRVTRPTILDRHKKALAGDGPHVTDIPGVLKWASEQHRLPPKYAARCEELRTARGMEPEKPKEDADWRAFREKAGGTKGHEAQLKTLEMFRDGYAMKLDKAMLAGDEAEVRRWNSLLIETTNAIRQNQLAAEKLGINKGDIRTNEEFDRVLWAIGFWMMRATDLALDALAARCANMPPGSDVKAFREMMAPELLSTRWLTVFAKASKASGVAINSRDIETMRRASGDFFENGEERFHLERLKP